MSKNFIISVCALLIGAGTGLATVAQPANLPPIAPAIPAPAPETPFARALIRLDDLEAQIRTLTDRIERTEAELANQKNENARLAKALEDTKAASLMKNEASAPTTPSVPIAPIQTAANPEVPEKQQVDANQTIAEKTVSSEAVNPQTNVPPEKQNMAVAAPPPPPPAQAALPKASAPLPAEPKPASATGAPAAPKPAPILLAEAKLQLQRSEFQLAENSLATLIAAYPNANETIEGHWLLGETRFVQRAYNAAALSYVTYLEKAPSGPKASDALLRLSSSFREIGDNRQRCLAFKEYQRRTPNPTPVQSARATAELAKGACN